MTDSPQFTADELALIADALADRLRMIDELHSRMRVVGSDGLERKRKLLGLRAKLVMLVKGERHGDVCPDGDFVHIVPDREDDREKL